MIFTSHIIVGSAVGELTGNSPVAFLGGFVSHHVLDCVPHLDPGTGWKGNDVFKPLSALIIATDLVVGTVVFYYIWKYSGFASPVMWGAIGSVLPDIVDNGPWRSIRKLPVFKQYHHFHESFHSTVEKENWLLGTLTQITIVTIALYLIFYTSH